MSRSSKVGLQLLVSGAVLALLFWQIDLGQTIDILRDSRWGYVAASFLIFLATTWLMAWRWWALLRVRGVHEPYVLARAHVLRQLRGQPGAADGRGRRRRPDRRARPAPARRTGDGRGRRGHGADPRLRRDARARRDRPRARGRALRGRAPPRHPRARPAGRADHPGASALLQAARAPSGGAALPAREAPQDRRGDAEPLQGDARVPQREGSDAPGPRPSRSSPSSGA